jgi:hypothetical protein
MLRPIPPEVKVGRHRIMPLWDGDSPVGQAHTPRLTAH